jgi:hypothetical protein
VEVTLSAAERRWGRTRDARPDQAPCIRRSTCRAPGRVLSCKGLPSGHVSVWAASGRTGLIALAHDLRFHALLGRPAAPFPPNVAADHPPRPPRRRHRTWTSPGMSKYAPPMSAARNTVAVRRAEKNEGVRGHDEAAGQGPAFPQPRCSGCRAIAALFLLLVTCCALDLLRGPAHQEFVSLCSARCQRDSPGCAPRPR